MGQPDAVAPARLPDTPAAHHLGDLARSDVRWSVYLEARPEGDLVAGRLHFAQGTRRRSTAWIFLERSEQDLLGRFGEFSAAELWKLLESLS